MLRYSMETMPLSASSGLIGSSTPVIEEEDSKSCCDFEIIDRSEYLLVPACGISLAGFIYALIAGGAGMAVITGIVAVSSGVAEWRVRALGIAKKLMDSVRDLKAENIQLKASISNFESQVDRMTKDLEKFEDVVGILGDNVEDIEQAKKQLFDLYDKYKSENDRFEANNLLTLFGLIDKDQNSKLDQKEIQQMQEYIKIVYKEEFDFDKLDTDDDGSVSLTEFFEKFRKRKEKIKSKKKRYGGDSMYTVKLDDSIYNELSSSTISDRCEDIV